MMCRQLISWYGVNLSFSVTFDETSLNSFLSIIAVAVLPLAVNCRHFPDFVFAPRHVAQVMVTSVQQSRPVFVQFDLNDSLPEPGEIMAASFVARTN